MGNYWLDLDKKPETSWKFNNCSIDTEIAVWPCNTCQPAVSWKKSGNIHELPQQDCAGGFWDVRSPNIESIEANHHWLGAEQTTAWATYMHQTPMGGICIHEVGIDQDNNLQEKVAAYGEKLLKNTTIQTTETLICQYGLLFDGEIVSKCKDLNP
jgi:hypothetical protein